MDEKIIACAAEVLRISTQEAAAHCKPVPEINGWYFWNPARGGFSMFIDRDGEKLAATSGISYEKHLQAFLSGKRN